MPKKVKIPKKKIKQLKIQAKGSKYDMDFPDLFNEREVEIWEGFNYHKTGSGFIAKRRYAQIRKSS